MFVGGGDGLGNSVLERGGALGADRARDVEQVLGGDARDCYDLVGCRGREAAGDACEGARLVGSLSDTEGEGEPSWRRRENSGMDMQSRVWTERRVGSSAPKSREQGTERRRAGAMSGGTEEGSPS